LVVGWIFHVAPFQISANVRYESEPLTEFPTAMQSEAEMHDTPLSNTTVEPAGLGVDLIFQRLPFHLSANARTTPEPFS
jgi:hypothetical protein